MKALTLALSLLAIFHGSQGEVGAPCMMKSECNADECCQIINIVVASKKRQLGLPQSGAGTCQRYRQEGENCDALEVMNGFCGCAEGLVCHTFHEPLHQVVGRRGALPPGYVQRCAPR